MPDTNISKRRSVAIIEFCYFFHMGKGGALTDSPRLHRLDIVLFLRACVSSRRVSLILLRLINLASLSSHFLFCSEGFYVNDRALLQHERKCPNSRGHYNAMLKRNYVRVSVR